MKKNALSVLIIDDDEKIKILLHRSVEKLGHSAEITGSCEEALLKLSQSDFDLAFIEVNLPDGDGAELMSRAKALHPELSVVAISGGLSRNRELRIREQRVNNILIKPFTMKEIQSILDHVVKRMETRI